MALYPFKGALKVPRLSSGPVSPQKRGPLKSLGSHGLDELWGLQHQIPGSLKIRAASHPDLQQITLGASVPREPKRSSQGTPGFNKFWGSFKEKL